MSKPVYLKNHAKQHRLLRAYVESGNLSFATQAAGVHRSTFYNWMREDRVFREAFAGASAERVRNAAVVSWGPGWNGTQTRTQHGRRQGVVYVLLADNGLVKIGRTCNFEQRLAMLNEGLPYALEVLDVFACEYPSRVETALHYRFAPKRVKGEWFRLTSEDRAAIKAEYGHMSVLSSAFDDRSA